MGAEACWCEGGAAAPGGRVGRGGLSDLWVGALRSGVEWTSNLSDPATSLEGRVAGCDAATSLMDESQDVMLQHSSHVETTHQSR